MQPNQQDYFDNTPTEDNLKYLFSPNAASMHSKMTGKRKYQTAYKENCSKQLTGEGSPGNLMSSKYNSLTPI